MTGESESPPQGSGHKAGRHSLQPLTGRVFAETLDLRRRGSRRWLPSRTRGFDSRRSLQTQKARQKSCPPAHDAAMVSINDRVMDVATEQRVCCPGARRPELRSAGKRPRFSLSPVGSDAWHALSYRPGS